MFDRPHHQRIARLLDALDGDLLRANRCLFGGGTVIALRYGEYRESVDVDFLVSDLTCYRDLRQLVRAGNSVLPLFRSGSTGFDLDRNVRVDQYGIRTSVGLSGESVKFEIVLEGRIELESPGPDDSICGVPTLTPVDMAATKLLANSDRWLDASVFSRDLIDLAMMELPLPVLRQAVHKAEEAYGGAVLSDLEKAITRLADQQAVLERCMQAMAIAQPKAVLWQRIRRLSRLL